MIAERILAIRSVIHRRAVQARRRDGAVPEVITAVTTVVTASWGGTQPDRLRPLAEELGMQREDGSRSDSDYDLGDLETLLLIAETAFGLSLDEADLAGPLLKVPDQPADPTPSARSH
ncbi:MAG: hypothetical protein ACRDP7_39215 [Trebonia sp.]